MVEFWRNKKKSHWNQAILPLHWESRGLGPQRAGRRQSFKTAVGRGQWRLNLYKWSSFGEIGRNPSTSGNIAPTPENESPGPSASRWETKGLNDHWTGWMTAKSVWMVEFWRNKKLIEIRQYCIYIGNRGLWVLSEQVGDKRLRRTIWVSDYC